MKAWCEKHALPGMKIEIVRLPGLTPLLYIEVPGSSAAASSKDCVLLYGHMDKQPEFSGWADGLDPWKPVLRDGRLYGRGGADDGYAVFGSLLALRALADQNIPFARSVILIEGSEESGSPDLPAYIDALADRIGEPSLVVCLDAECGNYDQFWCTTSLRGNLVGTLRVEVLSEGVHSGMASGIVPSSFRIARRVIERVENAETRQADRRAVDEGPRGPPAAGARCRAVRSAKASTRRCRSQVGTRADKRRSVRVVTQQQLGGRLSR